MNMHDKQGVHILLVEDNDIDIMLIQRALEQSRLINTIQICNNGEEAINVLRRKPPHEEAQTPDLILLDLNMPRMDGFEFLQIFKADDALNSIPVVVLTSSDDEFDILASYKLQANAYLTKPVEFNNLVHMIRELEGFWFEIVKLPLR